MASIETRLKVAEEQLRDIKAAAEAEQQKRQDWRLSFSFLPRTSKFELYVNIVLYLSDELPRKSDHAERLLILANMWYWVSKVLDHVRRSRLNQYDTVESTIQELKNDGRWSEFWQVFRNHLSTWNALNNWLKNVRARHADLQSGEQEQWKKDLAWKALLGRDIKQLLAECPVTI